MAWSDAARRAAVLARRLRRVEAYQPGGSRKQDQKDYLVAKLGIKSAQMRHRAKMQEFAARASFRKSQELHAGRGQYTGDENTRRASLYATFGIKPKRRR